jgi:hypothetical protein
LGWWFFFEWKQLGKIVVRLELFWFFRAALLRRPAALKARTAIGKIRNSWTSVFAAGRYLIPVVNET